MLIYPLCTPQRSRGESSYRLLICIHACIQERTRVYTVVYTCVYNSPLSMLGVWGLCTYQQAS